MVRLYLKTYDSFAHVNNHNFHNNFLVYLPTTYFFSCRLRIEIPKVSDFIVFPLKHHLDIIIEYVGINKWSVLLPNLT